MIKNFAKQNKLPGFRVKQFDEQFYRQAISSFTELTNWPKDLREKLKGEIEFSSIELVSSKKSDDGKTEKVLFKRKSDGKLIESVLMRYADGRNSVCVSCMVGCPVGCKFCATGKLGFGGNLTSHEIIDQIMHFQRLLKKQDQSVTNVVFMGMGEPLLNFDPVMESIKILTNPDKLALGQRRITISTCGITEKIEELVELGFKGKLAISFHAPNQEIREKIMPVAKKYPLDKLMDSLDKYTEQTNKRITYEYILIADLNDQPDHADQLAKLLKGRLAHVNLIPYNPVKGETFERPSRNASRKFADRLTEKGINATIRRAMGDEVDAACGQLAAETERAY